jgi:hypothetical protein
MMVGLVLVVKSLIVPTIVMTTELVLPMAIVYAMLGGLVLVARQPSVPTTALNVVHVWMVCASVPTVGQVPTAPPVNVLMTAVNMVVASMELVAAFLVSVA